MRQNSQRQNRRSTTFLHQGRLVVSSVVSAHVRHEDLAATERFMTYTALKTLQTKPGEILSFIFRDTDSDC